MSGFQESKSLAFDIRAFKSFLLKHTKNMFHQTFQKLLKPTPVCWVVKRSDLAAIFFPFLEHAKGLYVFALR